MGKIKSILAALVLFSVPAIWNLVASAAGNFGLESVTVLDKATYVVADTPTISGNTITSTIVFHELNDYVKYGIKLKNSTTTSYEILDITDNNTNTLVEYRYDNHANEVIAAGGSLDLDLTIFYVQAHADDSDRTQNNNVKFTISYLDLLTGTVEDDEVILVPDTGENTKEIVATNFVPGIVTFAIIFAGVALVAAILYKKKGIAVISVLAIVFTATGALNIGAVAEDYSDMDIEMNSELRLRDYFCGEVYWKNPDTGADIYWSQEQFGCYDFDKDDPITFGYLFDVGYIPTPDGLMITGFKFTDTDTDVDLDAPVLDDFSVRILYGERVYNITYDYNGGSVAIANPATVKKTDQSFTLNKPTKDTAYFYCWEGSGIPQYECEEDITIDPSTLENDLEYRALYRHEVIVNDQNGNELEHEFILEGHDEITYAKTFYPVGYTVSSGSCTNNQEIQIHTNSYTVNGLTNNTVCTVNITPKTYNVTLTVNNGTGSGTQNIIHGNSATFTGIAPNTDYTLMENVSCTNGQSATYSNGTVTVENVTGSTTCTMNALPPTIHSITYMQEMTPEICDATTTPYGSLDTANNDDWDGSHYGDQNYIPRAVLIDNRDQKKYLVAKLADGECWMTQNLGLDLSTETTFTSSNTDLNTISSYKPTRNTETIPTSGSPYGDLANASNLQLSWYTYSSYYVGNDTYANLGLQRATSPTCDSDECLWQTAGNLYTFYALSAGTYPYNGGTGVRVQDTICPKGWTLPEGQNLKDEEGSYTYERLPKSFYVLYNSYSPNKSSDEYMAFTRSGIFRTLFVGSYRSYVNSFNRPPEYYQELYRGAYATNFIADYHEQSNRVVSTQLQWHNSGSTVLGSEISVFGADGIAARCIAR